MPPREADEMVLARSAGLQAMRQKALEQQRLLREQHQEKIAQLMVEQGLPGLQGLQGFQALQGLPGLQGALLHDAQRRKAAELMAARQACAQQMSELVARHEHQLAAAFKLVQVHPYCPFCAFSEWVARVSLCKCSDLLEST